ncbi:MAG: hypothetical protein LAO56_18015 [Acidobacteriia bacterium]|jgi:hypothetical protein|nr:hypothetical protein [Terriglobia bacterium]
MRSQEKTNAGIQNPLVEATLRGEQGRREGKQVYFSLAMPEVKKACRLIQHVLRVQIRNGQKLAI